MSSILVCCLRNNGAVFSTYYLQFCNIIDVSPCRVCMAFICAHCSLVPEKQSGHKIKLLKGALHVNGWYIGFGWKVYEIVHGKRCKAFLYTPVSIRKDLSKRKAFLVLGYRTWTLDIVQPKKLHIIIVLPPNMNSSSFAHHHTWQAGLRSNGSQDRYDIVLGQPNTKL